eukprot:3267734-Prymnesium_polylepis.1
MAHHRPYELVGSLGQYFLNACALFPCACATGLRDGGREQARVRGRANDATVPPRSSCTFHSISCRRACDALFPQSTTCEQPTAP